MENFAIVVIVVVCIVGLLYFLTKKNTGTTYTPVTPPSSAPRPGTPAGGTPVGAPPASHPGTHGPAAAPPVRVSQQPQVPRDPVITVFEDKTIRQVRRCPSCDGENPPHAVGCTVCGRRL